MLGILNSTFSAAGGWASGSLSSTNKEDFYVDAVPPVLAIILDEIAGALHVDSQTLARSVDDKIEDTENVVASFDLSSRNITCFICIQDVLYAVVILNELTRGTGLRKHKAESEAWSSPAKKLSVKDVGGKGSGKYLNEVSIKMEVMVINALSQGDSKDPHKDVKEASSVLNNKMSLVSTI